MKRETFNYNVKNLQFEESTHTYTYKDKKVISVTQFLSQFQPKFNPYKISEQVSKNPNSEYYGLDPDVIRKIWANTGPRGTIKHNEIENYLLGNKSECKESEFLSNINITPGNSWPEIKLFSSKLMIAGTADIISYQNNQYVIYDIKTSKKVDNEKLKKFTEQVHLYCVMLKHMINNPEIEVAPGGIILISPIINLSKSLEEDEVKFKDPEFIPITNVISSKLQENIKYRKYEVKNNIL